MIYDLENISSYFESEDLIEIEVFNFDDFFKNKKIIEDKGYKFIGDDGNYNYIFEGEKKIIVTIESTKKNLNVQMPDYENSMINITSSIMKFYNHKSSYKSLEILDNILNDKYKHISFLILDGLAPYVVEKTLNENDILRKNIVSILSAVFPPTTACAIPCSASGKLALETGWVGWENHFKDINLDLVMFNGINYKTGQKTGINVKNNYIPYDNYFNSFDTYISDLEPSFLPGGFDTLKDMLKRMLKIQNEKDKSFTYAYWTEPDSTMHIYGTDSLTLKNVIDRLNDDIEYYYENMNEDSILIITADHGHIDVERIKLYEYEDIMSLLKRSPSNEGRCLFFEINDGKHKEFEDTFNKYFKSIYNLYRKDEFLELGFLGDVNKYKVNPIIHDFIGDFVAVAKSNYYFEYVKSEEDIPFKSHHAGLTSKEMEVPLIIIKK